MRPMFFFLKSASRDSASDSRRSYCWISSRRKRCAVAWPACFMPMTSSMNESSTTRTTATLRSRLVAW